MEYLDNLLVKSKIPKSSKLAETTHKAKGNELETHSNKQFPRRPEVARDRGA